MTAIAGSARAFFETPSNYLHKDFGVRARALIVRDLLQEPFDCRVLDVGCGNGGVSMQLIGANRVDFVDASEGMIALARRNVPAAFRDSASFHVGSLEAYEADGPYDIVLAIGLLAHVSSIDATLSKLVSLMKPGARVVLQFSDYGTFLTRQRIRLGRFYGSYSPQPIRYEALTQAIASHPLRLVSERRYSLLWPGMGKLPNEMLFRWTMLTYRNRWLSRFGTDYIWLLERDGGCASGPGPGPSTRDQHRL